MQMLCKVSSPFADVNCPICGQGFMVYWTRKRAGEREEQQANLQLALREQHGALSSSEAHAPAFRVAEVALVDSMPLYRPLPAGAIPVYS